MPWFNPDTSVESYASVLRASRTLPAEGLMDAEPKTRAADGAGESDGDDLPPRLRSAEELRHYLVKLAWYPQDYRRQQILEAILALVSTMGTST
jgi:hypothetical protein